MSSAQRVIQLGGKLFGSAGGYSVLRPYSRSSYRSTVRHFTVFCPNKKKFKKFKKRYRPTGELAVRRDLSAEPSKPPPPPTPSPPVLTMKRRRTGSGLCGKSARVSRTLVRALPPFVRVSSQPLALWSPGRTEPTLVGRTRKRSSETLIRWPDSRTRRDERLPSEASAGRQYYDVHIRSPRASPSSLVARSSPNALHASSLIWSILSIGDYIATIDRWLFL